MRWLPSVSRADEAELVTGSLVPVPADSGEPPAARPMVALERIAAAQEWIVQLQIGVAPSIQEIDGRGGGRRWIPAATPDRQAARDDDGGHHVRPLRLTGPAALPLAAAAMGQNLTASPPGPLGGEAAGIEAQLNEIRDLLMKQMKLMRPVEKKSYTVDEAAAQTAFSKWTIRNACSKKRITAEKSPDGQWRIPHEEVVQVQNQGLPK